MFVTLRKWLIRKPADLLTEREWEVIIAVCVHDMSISEVAARLHVTESTVYQYLSRIYTKLSPVRGTDELRDWYDYNYPSQGMNYRDYDD